MALPERVLVTGDRNWRDVTSITWVLRQTVARGTIAVVIHGAARGADTIAGVVARRLGLAVVPYPALWAEHGRAAGPIRNQRMLKEGKPTMVLAFHDNILMSKGTRDMVLRAHKAGLPIELYTTRGRDFDSLTELLTNG